MAMLTNGVVSGLISLLTRNKISDYCESLKTLLSNASEQTKKEELDCLKQTMRGFWNGKGRISLLKEEGKLALQNITNQLKEFLKENDLKKFNLVIFKELINLADAGYHQSLAFDAKAKTRELGVNIY